MTIKTFRIAFVVLLTGTLIGCGDVNAALSRLSDARQLSADLLVEFTKTANSADRAVMADTDTASIAYAHDAEQATASIKKDVDALGPILQGLGYTEETGLLQEFSRRFSEYQTLDRQILDLAVENTNLKAQQLSFGSSQDAADAFRTAIESVEPKDREKDLWRVKALAAMAVEAVREIQVLQAPHIAAADDAAMAALEKRMQSSEVIARQNLSALAPLITSASAPHVSAATADLDHFMELNGQIVTLSKRNTNVRSLALSLNQKAPLAAACEESLRALQSALAKRGLVERR